MEFYSPDRACPQRLPPDSSVDLLGNAATDAVTGACGTVNAVGQIDGTGRRVQREAGRGDPGSRAGKVGGAVATVPHALLLWYQLERCVFCSI